MILLVSHPGDDHLAPVQNELGRMGRQSFLLDTSQLPVSTAMYAAHSPRRDERRLRLPDGAWVDLGSCRSGWWRRALPPTPDPRITDPVQSAWAANETFEALSGFWEALPIAWVSPPRVIEKTMMKTWQLPAAREAGLEIPDTLITSDPEAARRFIDGVGLGKVVCKAFSATPEHWRETRLVTETEYAVLDRVAAAPVIFQEFVPAEVDLRITVVGEEFFPAAIHSQDLPYPLDFRLYLDSGQGVLIKPAELPREVQAGLRALLKSAGLRYGAIDMRRTPDGRHVFLEINPAGQWRFVEDATQQPITAALARLLADLDTA